MSHLEYIRSINTLLYSLLVVSILTVFFIVFLIMKHRDKQRANNTKYPSATYRKILDSKLKF